MEEHSESSSVGSFSSNESDEDSELSDSAKNILLYSVDALKRYIAINRIKRDKNSPLLDVSECIKSLDTERLRYFGQALRDDQHIKAIEVCLDTKGLDNQLAKDMAVFMATSPVLSYMELNRSLESDNRTDTKSVRVFLHAFLRNPNARDMYLWGIQSNESLPDITKAISLCQSLQSVKCLDCSLTTATSLLQGIILQKRVRIVDFSGIGWTDAENRLLQLLVVNHQSLQTLKLGSIPFKLFQCMANAISKLSHLSTLEFTIQQAQGGDDEANATNLITKVIAKSRSIRTLVLTSFNWRFDSDSASLDSHVNHTLEYLKLGGEGGEIDIYLSAVLSPWRKLKCLDMSELNGNLVIGESLVNLTRTHASLRKMKFRILDDGQVRRLFGVLRQQSTIQNLTFNMGRVTRETKEYMANTLSSPNLGLFHLSISDASGDASDLFYHLSVAIGGDGCSLTSLHVDWLSDSPTTDHVDRFFDGLRTNATLLNLSIKRELTVEGCLSICRHLPHLTRLTNLHFEIPSEFGEDHEDEFVRAMTANTSLTKVRLGMNASRLESIAEFYTTRNQIAWMFAEKDRRVFWPNILWKYDESTLFEFVCKLSNQIQGKRKAEGSVGKADESSTLSISHTTGKS